MPVKVQGIIELQNALRDYAPDLYKEMNKEWMQALASITQKARGFIPAALPKDLHNWENNGKKSAWAGYRPFPQYSGSTAKSGVKFRYRPSAANQSGFRALARIVNTSAAGAIYETAGRKNPKGAPRDPYMQTKAQFMSDSSNKGLDWRKRYHTTSHKYSASNNPMAGAYFIAILQHLSPLHDAAPLKTGGGRRSRKMRGRAIYRAAVEDQGKTIAKLMASVEKANSAFVNRVNSGIKRAA